MRICFVVLFFVMQTGWAVELVDLPKYNSLLKFDKKNFPQTSPFKKTDPYSPGCRVYKSMAEALTKAQTSLKLQGIGMGIKQCSPFSLKLEPIFEPSTIQQNQKKIGEFNKAMRHAGFKSSHPHWWDFSE